MELDCLFTVARPKKFSNRRIVAANAKFRYDVGMDVKNTLLDDIAAEIGYTATSVLAAWYGGRHLYVTTDPQKADQIAALIGRSAFERLVASFGGEVLAIPRNVLSSRYERWRTVFDMLTEGKSTREICDATGFSLPQIHNIRRTLEANGVMPTIFGAPQNAD